MEGHTLEGDFCVGEKEESALSDFQLCFFYTGCGLLPKNINLSLRKIETIIPCTARVPPSQDTGTLLQTLYAASRSKMMCCVFPGLFSFDPVSLLFLYSVALLTYKNFSLAFPKFFLFIS